MKNTLILLFLFLPLFGQDRTFKQFYMEGKQQLAAGAYADAIKSFKEALRIESKPQRYKSEGTFFEYYLPRYQIALCYEKTDLLEADAWCTQSREALEPESIKDKKLLATYHDDIRRIQDAAKKRQEQVAVEYNLALKKAQDLLAANRFNEAAKEFETLVKAHPSRTEAQVALGSLSEKKSNFLEKQLLAGQSALMSGNTAAAQAALDQMIAVDPGDPRIIQLKSAIEAKSKPVQVAVSEPKPAERPAPPVRQPQTKPTASEPKPAESPVAASQPKKEALKQTVRDALIASLAPYRQRGDAAKALEKLEDVAQQGQEFPSYHWLKGVYSLTLYQQNPQPDPALKQTADQAFAQVVKRLPQFEPDPSLYPEFIINAFKQAKGS